MGVATKRPQSPLVIKLGGSLAKDATLINWLEAILKHGMGCAVIVPGGGPFADAVRVAQKQIHFDDATAHRMAILAMEQYACMLSGMAKGFSRAATQSDIEIILQNGGVPIWLPNQMTLNACDIPASWDMTSDSLSAWLAAKINASDLVLVKSYEIPEGKLDLEALAQSGIVDPLFPNFAKKGRFAVHVLSRNDYQCFAQLIAKQKY